MQPDQLPSRSSSRPSQSFSLTSGHLIRKHIFHLKLGQSGWRFLHNRQIAVQPGGAESLNAFHVLGCTALHDMSHANEIAKPVWKTTRKLEFENDLILKTVHWILHLGL